MNILINLGYCAQLVLLALVNGQNSIGEQIQKKRELCPLTVMWHCNGVIRVAEAHIENDHSRCIESGSLSDLLPVGTVSSGYQCYPWDVGMGKGEFSVTVTCLSVQQMRWHEHKAPGISFRRVLPISATFTLFCLHLRCHRVQVSDIDESSVPFLFLCHCEVQTQQMHEAKGQQPRRQSKTPAGLV